MPSVPVLDIWTVNVPHNVLELLDKSTTRHVLLLLPYYGSIQDKIKVRVGDVLVLDSLWDLRTSKIDVLV